MKQGAAVLVDTGAWIALALVRDPLHERARFTWERLHAGGARLHTTIPIVLETFTFLERNAARDAAMAWKDGLSKVPRLRLLECTAADMAAAWEFFKRRELHKLSAVDATSFVIMKRQKIKLAFTFDQHFFAVGFRPVE